VQLAAQARLAELYQGSADLAVERIAVSIQILPHIMLLIPILPHNTIMYLQKLEASLEAARSEAEAAKVLPLFIVQIKLLFY
jgi:hypothetical protein